jgi:hypothetical protein
VVERHLQTFHHREKKKVWSDCHLLACWVTRIERAVARRRGEPGGVALCCGKLKLTAVVVAQLPSFVDWFGWCTWDAFYTDVTAEGVKQGLKR